MNAPTSKLHRADPSEPQASADLLPLVYQELRKLAAVKMAQQPPGHTLQATALVHEAWLKLARGGTQSWKDRKHFFSTAAEAMRQVLIDRARKKQALRHGGGCVHVDSDAIQIASPVPDAELLELNEALEALVLKQPVKAEVVKLKFFAGLNEKEIADLLGMTERTVQRYWAFSQVWLFDRIRRK